MKLHVFKSSGEQTYNSDNENMYQSKFAWYAERSSWADISRKSNHLMAFELVNPLLYIYFPRSEYITFRKIWPNVESETSFSSEAMRRVILFRC